jgi:hypothetical protein
MPTQRELDHEARMRRWQIFQNLGNSLLRTACIVTPFFFAWLAVRDLAGKQTYADIGFKAVADLKMNEVLAKIAPWGTSALATGWAVTERTFRKANVKRVSTENSKLQKQLDPGRRSSSLTEVGDTSPEDV